MAPLKNEAGIISSGDVTLLIYLAQVVLDTRALGPDNDRSAPPSLRNIAEPVSPIAPQLRYTYPHT